MSADLMLSLLPFAVIVAVVWLLLRPTFFRRWLSRIGESSIYQKSPSLIATPDPPPVALPYVLIAWGATFVVGLFVGPGEMKGASLEQIALAQRDYSNFRNLIMAITLPAAVILHVRPNHSRELKYTLILAPFLCANMVVLGGEVRDLARGFEWGVDSVATAVLYIIVSWSVLVFVWICFSARRSAKAAESFIRTGQPKSVMHLFAFCRTRAFGPLVLGAFIYAPDFAIIFLAGRYVLVEAFRRHPVLYLRSFHYESASAAFGRAIAPAIGPTGVVRALVHGTQTGRVLLASTSIWQFGILETVTDDVWQEWVSDRLRKAALAIIDCSFRTESLDWEIKTSLQTLGPSRVLVVTSDPTTASAVGASAVIPYSNDKRGIASLRSQVAQWAANALNFNARKAARISIVIWILVYTFMFLKILAIVLIFGP